MTVPMSKCVRACVCVCVWVCTHMTRHVPNVMVSMCLCVMEPPPSHIGIFYLPNVCACFCSSLVLAKCSSNVLAPFKRGGARMALERVFVLVEF